MDGRVTICGSMCAGIVTACETSLGNGAGLGVEGPKRPMGMGELGRENEEEIGRSECDGGRVVYLDAVRYHQ